MSNGTVIICKGNGEVTCKSTVALPHYENAIATVAIKFPHDVNPVLKTVVVAAIEAHVDAIQQLVFRAIGGQPYEFTGDPSSLPECLSHP